MNTSEQYKATYLFNVFYFSDRFRLITLLLPRLQKRNVTVDKIPAKGVSRKTGKPIHTLNIYTYVQDMTTILRSKVCNV